MRCEILSQRSACECKCASAIREDLSLQESCAVALEEIERLNSIVSRLLNFAEPMSLHVQPTRVHDLVEQRLDAFREAAEKKGVRFHHGFSGGWKDVEI